MSYINRIRDRLKVRPSFGRTDGAISRDADDLPLDHQLTFKRGVDEKWTFKDGHIYVNDDIDIEDILDYQSRDVRLWCGISEAVAEYRAFVLSKNGGRKDGFLERVDRIQEKVLGHMKRLFDEKTDGMCLSFGNGEVFFNNFNVRAFIAMYYVKPTKKARQFLISIKSKLALILVNKSDTPQHERVRRVIQQLYEEVLGALEIPPIEARCITSGCVDKSL